MKVVYFAKEPWEKEYVKGKLSDAHVSFYDGTISDHPDVRETDAEILSVFVDSKVGSAELNRFQKLKLIATRSTGFDHIDLKEAAKRGIVVANVPSYGENTVAEFAFGLLLALSRRIIDADERVRQVGAFSQENLTGFDLKGKTLGIVGVGHIGMHMIKMARGFDMNVIAFDVHSDATLAKELGFVYVPLEELFSSSDIISLHVPYNPHTHHLINMENIGTLKKGVHIINTARGAVIETDALVEGLKRGIVAGAALDVLEEEDYVGDELQLLAAEHPNASRLKTTLENHYLILHPRVIVTPHIAFNTQEAITRILDTTVENIKSFAAGRVQNIVGGSI